MTAARALGVLLVWFAAAVLAGASGVLAARQPPFLQMVLVALVLALLALFQWVPTFQSWALGLDIRALVLLHVTRVVGIYFLVLHGQGALPWAFAVPGGWGDILVAALALLVVWRAPRRGFAGWVAYATWNLLGLLDILFVVVTATRLAMAEPGSMRALTVLPLSLLPTFLVPLIIATHVVIFVRLARSRRLTPLAL